ncbi:MAG: hypothetical protein AAGF25_02250 [Pseudomonadota bacterium]
MTKDELTPAADSKSMNQTGERYDAESSEFEPISLSDEGQLRVSSHSLSKVCGSKNTTVMREVLDNIAQYSALGDSLEETDLQKLNGSVALVNEIGPTDVIEGMLATQMVAVHQAIIRHSRKLLLQSSFEGQRLHETALNKLSRTFTAQMEALRKHRHGGEQIMRVERVTVNDGGQAVVGNVNHKKGSQKDDR